MTCDVQSGQVGWAEVEHWMWPLFAPKWMQWRQQRLGLPPMLSQCTEHMSDASSQPQAKRLRLIEVAHAVAEAQCPSQPRDNSSTTGAAAEASLQGSTEAVAAVPYGMADTQSPSQSHDNSSTTGAAAEASLQDSTEAVAAVPLPRPVQLLYGLSPQVILQPGYWPDSIHMCGFWQPAQRKQVSLAVTANDVAMSAAFQWLESFKFRGHQRCESAIDCIRSQQAFVWLDC